MKKKDWIFIGVILGIAVLMYAGFQIYNSLNKKDNQLGVVYHNNEMLFKFDVNEDKTYSFEGSYGHMELEVKEGKWHIINEECPNHICSNMGWVGITDLMPIVCLPNEVYVQYEGE